MLDSAVIQTHRVVILMRALIAFYLSILASVLLAQQPHIDSISPAQGPIAGGTFVTIAGANFQGATVTIDKLPVVLPVISATEIHFTTPVHDNGIASIKVANASGAAYGEFLFVPPSLADLPPGYITTVAGIGHFTGLFRLATRATVWGDGTPAFDRDGMMYIPESVFDRVTRVRSDGIIEPFAGTGDVTGDPNNVGDSGPATDAIVGFPRGVALDSQGNAYITSNEHRIRRVDGRSAIITTIAGNGFPGFSGDGGPAVLAQVSDPSKIVADRDGTVYFIDCDNARIRRITAQGTISTVVGTGTPGFSGDGGAATQAQFDVIACDFGGLAIDPGRYLYLADTGNHRVRRIDLQTGVISTVVGPTDSQGNVLDNIWGVAVDANSNFYFANSNDGVIREMSVTGQPLATYGHGFGTSDDGTPIKDAYVNHVHGLAIDPAGNIVFAEVDDMRVRRLNLKSGLLETVAGMVHPIGENGPAIAAVLHNDSGDVTFLPTGELLIGDGFSALLRKLDKNGNLSTLRSAGYAISAKPDATGSVYLADVSGVISQIDARGELHAFAGASRDICGLSGDGGPAADAQLCEPWDVLPDRAGNVFIADTNNNRIRRVDGRTGIITTVVGSGPVNGYENYEKSGTFCGDGGPAIQACLNTPYGLALDAAGNLFIADSGNKRIRKVDANGIITTFAADIPQLSKLTFDRAGYLYSAHAGPAVGVWRYDSTGAPTLVAGVPLVGGFSGDGGPALQARTRTYGQSVGVAIDNEGNLFFTDGNNERVRAVRYGAVLAPPNATVQATAIGATIHATVLDASAHPAPGVRVDFSAPTSGASCTLSNSSAITDTNGVASVTCTPNCLGGTYIVTARPLAASSLANISFTNLAGPCRRRSVHH